MDVRWLTAFIDRPSEGFDAASAFWAALTGTTLSSTRGSDGEFATLEPSEGDACLRVQRVVTGGGSHPDVHVGDVMAAVARAEECGATAEHEHAGVSVLRSPAGLTFCVVSDDGSTAVPPPATIADGAGRIAVQKLCIDVPADRYEAECEFWSAFTGWESRRLRVADGFAALAVPDRLPFGLLVQRLGDDSPALVADAHLDLACDDVDAMVVAHRRLGGSVVEAFERWTVMADPAGVPYCLIRQAPR